MNVFLHLVLKASLIIYMVGNLSSMGLQLRVVDAIVPLKNLRFVLTTLIAGFVLGPALAFLVTATVPMQQPCAMGVPLLGMAPSSFLPNQS